MPGVERGACNIRVRGIESRASVGLRLGDDAAIGINAGRDSGVGRPQQPAMVFNGPHPRHVQVLTGCAARAKPSVIGDIDEDLSTARGKL